MEDSCFKRLGPKIGYLRYQKVAINLIKFLQIFPFDCVGEQKIIFPSRLLGFAVRVLSIRLMKDNLREKSKLKLINMCIAHYKGARSVE